MTHDERIEAVLSDRHRWLPLLPKVVQLARTELPGYLQSQVNVWQEAVADAAYLDQMVTQSEIARMRGKSRQHISQRIKRVLRETLRRHPELLEDL